MGLNASETRGTAFSLRDERKNTTTTTTTTIGTGTREQRVATVHRSSNSNNNREGEEGEQRRRRSSEAFVDRPRRQVRIGRVLERTSERQRSPSVSHVIVDCIPRSSYCREFHACLFSFFFFLLVHWFWLYVVVVVHVASQALAPPRLNQDLCLPPVETFARRDWTRYRGGPLRRVRTRDTAGNWTMIVKYVRDPFAEGIASVHL